jgi:hypothetical protein
MPVNAFAPDDGEKINAGSEKYPPPPLNSALVPDTAGFRYIGRVKFHEAFCEDLSAAEARVMEPGLRAIPGEADGREDDQDQVEPRVVHFPPGRGCSAD